MIYINGKPQTCITTGLEDIPAGRNCFDLGRIKVAPAQPTEQELAKQAAIQRNRETALARYYRNTGKNSDPRAFRGQTHNFTQSPTPSKTVHFSTGRNATI
jgi:hypothetical protein